jgi:hypothetical protein
VYGLSARRARGPLESLTLAISFIVGGVDPLFLLCSERCTRWSSGTGACDPHVHTRVGGCQISGRAGQVPKNDDDAGPPWLPMPCGRKLPCPKVLHAGSGTNNVQHSTLRPSSSQLHAWPGQSPPPRGMPPRAYLGEDDLRDEPSAECRRLPLDRRLDRPVQQRARHPQLARIGAIRLLHLPLAEAAA